MTGIKINSFKPIEQVPVDMKERVRDVAKLYEHQFLDSMVKEMRKTVDHSSLTEPSMAEKIYSEQLDQQYTETWANRGGIGLADMIYNQLVDRLGLDGAPPAPPQGPVPLNKGSKIKIDDTQQMGIPVSQKSTKDGLSLLMEPSEKTITSPWDGRVIKSFSNNNQQSVVEIAHDDGLKSQLGFKGLVLGLENNARVTAGQKIGLMSPDAQLLSWKVIPG